MTTLISIVSPVYGCSDCLEILFRKVHDAFDGTDLNWELLLIDDRGPDDPWPLIQKQAVLDSKVRGIRLSRNHGQHLAIWAGLAKARGDWVAIIDCDLQDDPSIIPLLHKTALEKKVEAIVVERGIWTDSWFRRSASRVLYRIMRALGGVSIENAGNFGLYSRKMVVALLQYEEQEVFLPMMVALSGLRCGRFTLNRSERAAGKSSYSFWRLLSLASSVIVRFSDRPLKLSILVGFAFSMLSAVISVVLVALWLLKIFTVPGWTSTILSVWFLSGLIMGTLGIHGLYIGKVFSEVKKRPRIVIEASTDNSSGTDFLEFRNE